VSCEFYKRLAEGPLARVAKGKWEHLIKAIKLLVGAIPPTSSGVSPPSLLVETVEFVVNLFKHGPARELVELIKAAKSAGQCDEEVKRAAKKLGVSEKWLRTLAQNLASLPEVDLSQLEERARALEKGLDLLKRLSPHILDLTQLFMEKESHLLVNSPFGPVEYVEVGVEDKVRQALSRGGVAVVYGPRGVGKSTAALEAIYDFSKPQPHREVIVVRVGENWKDAIIAADQLRNGPFIPVLYYDTLEAKGYVKSEEKVDVLYSSMAHVKPLADFLHDVALLRVPTVVVLAEEDYRAYEDVVKRVGAEAVRLGGEAEALVRGILRGVPDAVAEAVLEKYKGEFYAVAAALAKALYEEWRDPAKIADAVRRLDVHSLALAYLWHVVLGGDEAVARRAAPLILATGFFGPHPPKLAKAIIRAFGEKPEDAVVRWFSQPLHGTLYETIRKVARGAVYRRFKVGSDELCEGEGEEPCRLVEICFERLVGVPRKRYKGVVEVAMEYAKLVAERLKAPGPDGVRQIDSLIDDFLQAHNGVAEDGRWRIRYEVKGPEEVKVVEEVIDELDVLSTLYGVAVLPSWDPQIKPLKEWFFVNGRKVKVVGLYLHPLLRERGGELIKKAVAIVREAEKRGFYTGVDILRAVSIVAVGLWKSASDEELENAMRLAAYALDRFATVSATVLVYFWPLLSETWRRVVSRQDGRLRQRLADWLIVAMKNAARGHPLGLLLSLVSGIDNPDQTVTQRFDALYNAASYAGRLWLLYALLSTLDLDIGGVNVVTPLLGKHGPKEVFEEVIKRVEELISQLYGVEKTYAVANLYPLVAFQHTFFNEFDKALKFAKEALKALDELRNAYEKDKALTEEKLRPYLELRQVKPDFETELKELSWHVYHHAARVYKGADDLSEAVVRAVTACDLARELNSVYYEVLSCSLPLRLSVIKGDAPPVEEFEKLWQRALHDVARLGAEAIATTLGEYVVALASADRLSEAEKVLKEWGWALELHPDTSALTYGVLSLFDGRYLENVLEHLPEGARANLPKFVDVLRDANEAGLFTKIPEIVASAMNTLAVSYGLDVVITFSRIVSDSANLFLSALVGLAYCKRGEEWGFKLAKESARVGSSIKGIASRLFAELYKALENATMDNCITEDVLGAVYKLYYLHV